MKRAFFSGLLLVLFWGILESSSWLGLKAAARLLALRYQPVTTLALADDHRRILERLLAGDSSYVAYSPALGWSLKPNGTSTSGYRANAEGIRADVDYATAPPASRVRIAAFGDSFTHGDGVANADTWPRLLEASAPDLDVLNFGVGGYGLDQAYLRYRLEGRSYQPRLVLIGFMTENIHRSVSVFRPFYTPDTGVPLAKPRYVLENGRLRLVENPIQTLAGYRELIDQPARVLPRLGAKDYYYRRQLPESAWDILPSVRLFKLSGAAIQADPIVRDGRYNDASEAFMVTSAIFDAFERDVLGAGAIPLILIFPGAQDLWRYRRDGTRVEEPLLRYLDRKRYAYVDLRGAFDACLAPCTVESAAPVHYTAQGNRLVADFVLKQLKSRRLLETRPSGSVR